MLEMYTRPFFEKSLIQPLLSKPWLQCLSPLSLTLLAALSGSLTPIFAYLSKPILGVFCLIVSGCFDILDGSLARALNQTSPGGAALDICSDRWVESMAVLALFLIDPQQRGLMCLLMMISILLCVTSFLVVGIFSHQKSEKSFYYSPGLMERPEAFLFFALMFLFPSLFFLFAPVFSFLTLFTGFWRLKQFCMQC